MRNLFLLILFFISSFSYSQSFKYRNNKFTWPAEKPAPIPVEEQFKNEDAVILDEQCVYSIAGFKIPFVQKHLRIKFLNRNGIKKYSKIVLPESFDPTSDCNSVALELRDSIYRPKGEFECIRYFNARILKPDGQIVQAVINESTQTEVWRVNQIDQKLYSWIFRIINLEEGDELELDYAYEGALNIDPSSRIFFNGELPKQNFHLTFRCSSKSTYMLNYHNDAGPNDSVMATLDSPHNTEYYFSRKNLIGGILEPGARPHQQLPYFTFYRHSLDFGIQNPKTKYISKALPYPWSYIMLSNVGYRLKDLKTLLSKQDKTTIALNAFYETEKLKAKDTLLAIAMSSIQHTLAEEFSYLKDRAASLAGDAELEHLGKYVDEKILRETSRYRLYNEILRRFDQDYYEVQFYDKRISAMDIMQYERLTSLRNAFAIPFQNNFIYLYPKSYRFGYEANELPFYYEDIRTILVPEHEATEKQYSFIPLVNFTFVKTPFSGAKENVRTTNAMLDVSLDSLKMSYNGKIKLAGQFSTLIRGYYIYGDQDTTVNPNYYLSVSTLADGKADLKAVNVSRQFPFDASFNTNFTNHRNISKEQDGVFSIELRDFFNEVIDDKFSSVNRHLDYYPDFQFQDSYKYMMKFDRKVTLQNTDSLQKDIHNSYADYVLKTTQVDEQSILIEISYVVKPEFVPASKAREIADVFDEIKSLNKNSLKLKIQ